MSPVSIWKSGSHHQLSRSDTLSSLQETFVFFFIFLIINQIATIISWNGLWATGNFTPLLIRCFPSVWEKSPSLKDFIPSVFPFLVSSLFIFNLDSYTTLGFSHWRSLDSSFKCIVCSYCSLLNILIIPFHLSFMWVRSRIWRFKSWNLIDNASC